MGDPLFVIHGIGTRDRDGFQATVARLGSAVGRDATHPVFWGDLGARYAWIERTVPDGPRADDEVRDGESGTEPHTLAEFLIDHPGAAEVRESTPVPQPLLDAALANLAVPGGEEIRDEPPGAVSVRTEIARHWSDTVWLPRIDDVELLRAVGAAITGPFAEDAGSALPGGAEIRDHEIRGLDIGGFVKRRLHELDRLVGAAFGAAGGRLNAHLRTQLLPGVTRFVGDILVYQRHRDRIQQRVREVVAEVDPALGRDADHPVDIVAHSLGGVIAVDMATAEDPLWVRTLVTFGSQSSFFHVCDPRGGALQPFEGSSIVRLPPSLGAWTNLWEPLDVVAFIAARVFQLHDGTMREHRVEWRAPTAIQECAQLRDRRIRVTEALRFTPRRERVKGLVARFGQQFGVGPEHLASMRERVVVEEVPDARSSVEHVVTVGVRHGRQRYREPDRPGCPKLASSDGDVIRHKRPSAERGPRG